MRAAQLTMAIRELLKEAHRALILCKTSFFVAKLRRMRLAPAAHEPHRVFQVEHFMVEDVPDNVLGNTRVVELPVDDDLVERRIETAKLGSPRSPAPAERRPGQGVLEILSVQPIKQGPEVMMRPRGTVVDPPRTVLPDEDDVVIDAVLAALA